MIGNIKRTFPAKTVLQEKQVLQDPGYVEGTFISYVKGVKSPFNLQCRF